MKPILNKNSLALRLKKIRKNIGSAIVCRLGVNKKGTIKILGIENIDPKVIEDFGLVHYENEQEEKVDYIG